MKVTKVTVSEVYNFNKVEAVLEFSEEEARDLEFIRQEIDKVRDLLRKALLRTPLSEDAEKALDELRRISRMRDLNRDDVMRFSDRVLCELIANGRLYYDFEKQKWVVK